MSFRLIHLLPLLIAVPAAAQLALPRPPVVGDVVDDVLRQGGGVAGAVIGSAGDLAAARLARIDSLVRANRDRIERDDVGQPARRGELLLVDPDVAALASAAEAGFALLGRERLDEIGIEVARLAVPDGMALRTGLRRLRRALPGREISADQLLMPSGSMAALPLMLQAGPASASTDTPVGMIDSGVASTVSVTAMRGFAGDRVVAANHGTAIASLLRAAGVRRLYVADVYGDDPAGGSTLMVARAIDWLLAQRVRVISISLVGADNVVLRRSVLRAELRGAVVVAAVGNDGPAAPPAYPASYPQVIAVTAVDGRNRALIEAGRALHIDYAAPGADLMVTAADGRRVGARGTSYATPLVAARLAHAMIGRQARGQAIAVLDAEAVDLGRRGPDARFGRGLLCGGCRSAR